MAISAAEGSTQNNLDQLESEFLELLNTARDPSDSNAISSDRLAKKLGIDGLPDRQEALKLLEEEILAPVRDLSGPGLSQWQTSVL
jgi:antiviral helicase SKI2